MNKYILALDQGTTSSRAIVFGRDGHIVSLAQEEFEQILPAPGFVEHDPEAIWNSQLRVARQAMEKAGATAAEMAALGITNQRETTVLWDRETGRPVANAIVWQSRASAGICDRLKADGLADTFRSKTGLVIDAYFSGTKIKHLLDTIEGLRARAEEGKILFGTIDSYLVWRLTEGRLHVTDYSNASRTLIYNIHKLDWDDELLRVLDIPRAMLPGTIVGRHTAKPRPTYSKRPFVSRELPETNKRPRSARRASCLGKPKNTWHEAFMLLNTGETPVPSDNNLLTTIGWGLNGKVTYCLEGSIFIAGAVVQWLRDGLQVIESSSEVERLAASVNDSGGVYLVPAFVGLGAPYWDQYARGAILGITRGTTAGHLARAAVESMAYQSADLVEAMQKDAGIEPLAQSRWRRDERLAVAIPVRHFGRRGATACRGRNHGPGRRLSGRVGGGILGQHGRRDAQLGARSRVRAQHSAHRTRKTATWLG